MRKSFLWRALLFSVVVCSFVATTRAQQSVIISEFMAANGNIIADEDHAPTGMTPDGEQAMLPLDLFALEVSATLSRTFHALPAEPLAEYLIVLDAPDPDLFPEFTLEGMSNLPFFFAIDPSVLPAGVPAAGDFRLQFVLRDAGGNGYRLESAFDLVPVPAAGTTPLLALCVAGLPFLRRPRHVAGRALRRE